MLKVFNQQVEATGPIKQAMNSLQGSAKSLMTPFNALMERMWDKFGFVLYQVIRIFSKMMSAFDRVFGMATASLFAGMAMFKAILNSMNFVINVCNTILITLTTLVIVLFFVLFPVLPIILTMIGILSATVHAGRVSGMADTFCVSGDTRIPMADGVKEVCHVKPGERLADGSLVEGVLETIGGPVVKWKGIVISRSHLVWHEGRWSPAGELPGIEEAEEPDRLYCLNTDSHVWDVLTPAVEKIHLRDWEELPEGFDDLWESLIASILDTPMDISNPGRGLVGPQTRVEVEGKGVVEISEVRLGDRVRDGDGFTRVLGIYKDCSEGVPQEGANAAAWVKHGRTWQHRIFGTPVSKDGWHLVTESGTFTLEGGVTLRDFTEVGVDKIHETYQFVAILLAYNIRNDAPHNLSNQCSPLTDSRKCADDKLCVSGIYGAP